MISVKQALNHILETTPEATSTEVSLSEAHGRILAQKVLAEREGPPFERVAMDGIAFNLGKGLLKQYKIEGIQAAGSPQLALLKPEHCIEVMTGAILPKGCDCVIPYEKVLLEDNVAFPNGIEVSSFKNVHRMGSDYKKGDVLLEAGEGLGPAEIAIVASQGLSHLKVFALPKVAVVCTGNELVDVEGPLEPHQIRKSNVYAISAMLKNFGVERIDSFHIRDDLEESIRALKGLIAQYEVIILSGGVSKGKYDFVPKALEAAGVEKKFHRIRQKPGKPFFYGTTTATQIFGLPGNPVSSLICMRKYVIPSVLKRQNTLAQGLWLPLAEPFEKEGPLCLFVPTVLKSQKEKGVFLERMRTNGSGDFNGLKGSSGFFEIPQEKSSVNKEELVLFTPWKS